MIFYFRYPEKPPKDIQQSEVYKMIQESESQGKRVTPLSPASADQSPRFLRRQNSGMSFRVLQWLTDTDNPDDEAENEEQCRNCSNFTLTFNNYHCLSYK